jgi:hypothetical protein
MLGSFSLSSFPVMPPMAAGLAVNGLLGFESDRNMLSSFEGIVELIEYVSEPTLQLCIFHESVPLGVGLHAYPIYKVPRMDIDRAIMRNPKALGNECPSGIRESLFDLLDELSNWEAHISA